MIQRAQFFEALLSALASANKILTTECAKAPKKCQAFLRMFHVEHFVLHFCTYKYVWLILFSLACADVWELVELAEERLHARLPHCRCPCPRASSP